MGIRSRIIDWSENLFPLFNSLDLNSEDHAINAADKINLNLVDEDVKSLCVKKHLLATQSEIDYINPMGDNVKIIITTEEFYEYENGNIIISAFCPKTNCYQLFSGKRIALWRNIEKLDIIKTSHDDKALTLYLRNISDLDPNNIAKKIYEAYIYEINIVFGSLIRWNRKAIEYGTLVNWLLKKNFSKKILEPISVINKDEVWDELLYLIKNSKVDVTLIKASVRTLLHSSDERKHALIDFIEKTLEGQSNWKSASETLRADLLKEDLELGYSIPVMDPLSAEQVKEIKNKAKDEKYIYKTKTSHKVRSKVYRASEIKNAVKLFSIDQTVRRLTDKLNAAEFVFEKETFEADIKSTVSVFFSNKEIEEEGDMFINHIAFGVSFGYLIFGLKNQNNGWYKDANGNKVIDLRNTSIELN